MIEELPIWVSALFIFATVATILLYYFANGKAIKTASIIILWSILQSLIASTGFYKITETIPPRFALLLIPSTLLIIYGLKSKSLSSILSQRDPYLTTLIHTVRFPIELILFALFTHKLVPELMTYEGWNFDIVMGITAPFIVIMLYKKLISEKILLAWNIIGLILILLIMIIGILSAELPFQQFGYDQPNIAVTFFPYILLPATIVPIVIYTHITEIIRLLRKT